MGVFEQFPYTNIHNLNLDWVLREISQMKDRIEQLPNVVQETGDSETDVMSQKAVTDLDAQTRGLIPSVVSSSGSSTLAAASQKLATDLYNDAIAAIPEVVQSTGTSTSKVMSQKAVTDAIDAGGGVASIEHYHQAMTTITPSSTINDKIYEGTSQRNYTGAVTSIYDNLAAGVYEATIHSDSTVAQTTDFIIWSVFSGAAAFPGVPYMNNKFSNNPANPSTKTFRFTLSSDYKSMSLSSYDTVAPTLKLIPDARDWEWDGQPADSVGSAAIQAGAVTTAKIASKAVTTAKIDDEAVTATQIADGTITSGKFNTAARIPGVQVVTTAPTADNTDGLKFAVLSAEPGTYYSGWVYIITE